MTSQWVPASTVSSLQILKKKQWSGNWCSTLDPSDEGLQVFVSFFDKDPKPAGWHCVVDDMKANVVPPVQSAIFSVPLFFFPFLPRHSF